MERSRNKNIIKVVKAIISNNTNVIRINNNKILKKYETKISVKLRIH